MSVISDFIKEKESLTSSLNNILSSYIEKYLYKLYKSIIESKSKKESSISETKIMREFQRALSEIGQWDDEKQKHEYKKFLKWCMKKHDVTEIGIQTTMDKIILYSTRIILNKYEPGIIERNVSYRNSEPKDLFFKCIKRIARYYYDNPKLIHKDNSVDVENMLESCVHTFIPMKQIIKVIEEHDGKEDNRENMYNFDENSTSSTESINTKSDSTSSSHHVKSKLVVEKTDEKESELQLPYVNSDVYNEYYQSEEQIEKEDVDVTDEVKMIKIPKNNKK